MFAKGAKWNQQGCKRLLPQLPASSTNSYIPHSGLFATSSLEDHSFNELIAYSESEQKEIVEAAMKLMSLAGKGGVLPTSASTTKVQEVLVSRRDNKRQILFSPKRFKSNPHPVHSDHYLEEVKKILSGQPQFSKIAVTDRKNALRAVLSILCPLVELKECGQTNKRVFVVKQGKRFRTYGDAIKSGALDELIIRTGTSLLLCGCHKQAEERYDALMLKAC